MRELDAMRAKIPMASQTAPRTALGDALRALADALDGLEK